VKTHTEITVTISPETFAQIIDAVSERVLEPLAGEDDRSPWLDSNGAADYLSWPRERIYKHRHELPHYKHGNRLMFRRDELDRFVEQHRERRA
jgi:excisionase family DNA binding protein